MTPGAPVPDLHGIELPPRYEIRQITSDLADWVSALQWYEHFFQSPMWASIAEGRQAKEALSVYHGLKPWYQMPEQVAKNGLSYIIWDKEYVFKRPESAAEGGACYWDDFDLEDPDLEVNGRQKLLDALDFPIVSSAMSYDKFAIGDPAIWADSMQYIGWFGPLTKYHEEHDPRPKGSWEPTGPGQVIERIGTGTRAGYEGQGLMKALARFVMLEMKSRGYRAIQIDCGAPQVHHVWSNPPAPFRSSTLSALPTWFLEIEEDGKKVRPYEKSKLASMYLVWTELLD